MRERIAIVFGSMITISALISGCATQSVSDPRNISLRQAMVETVDALSAANKRGKELGTGFAFYGCSITAVYNISATANQDNKLSLAAGLPSTAPVSLSGNVSAEATAAGSKGNTVTLILDTPYCLPNSKAKPPTVTPKPVVPTPAG